MVKTDFNKILKLASFNKHFFGLSDQNAVWKKILKVILILVFAPVYAVMSAIIYLMYLMETLLTIPSKFVHGVRATNTPYDEKNRFTFNVSYVILYFWIVPFDAFAIFFSWLIALLSLLLDLIGNIVCLGNRHLAASELCFANVSVKENLSKKHFWATFLEIALVAILVFIMGGLARRISTTYELVENGLWSVTVEHINFRLYETLRVILSAIGYTAPTTLLIGLYNKNNK